MQTSVFYFSYNVSKVIFKVKTTLLWEIEDITWPRGDPKFLFKCWKIHEKRNFVSPSGHVMFYLLHKHQWNTKPIPLIIFWCERRDLLCSHSNGDIFTCEDNTLFSHVKISSFHAKAHLVFQRCLYNIVNYIPLL